MHGQAGYSGKPLTQKLGVKAGMTVVLVGAPTEAEALLTPLPDAVTLRRGNRGRCEITIWFVTSRRNLRQRFARSARSTRPGPACG
jgi:hypothetical protein